MMTVIGNLGLVKSQFGKAPTLIDVLVSNNRMLKVAISNKLKYEMLTLMMTWWK